jgi:hypothetical protein
MTMQTISYKRGYIHFTTEGNTTRVEAQNENGERKLLSSERAAKEWLNRYQGHKNWNYWNVSLYINNEFTLYRMAKLWATPGCGLTLEQQAAGMLRELGEQGITKTPDGASYSVSSIKAVLRDINS